MQTHTVEVTDIPEPVLKLVDERAKEQGTDRNTFLRQLIEREVQTVMTLRELFAPVREDIRASGLSEDELDALLEEARDKAYQARQLRGAK